MECVSTVFPTRSRSAIINNLPFFYCVGVSPDSIRRIFFTPTGISKKLTEYYGFGKWVPWSLQNTTDWQLFSCILKVQWYFKFVVEIDHFFSQKPLYRIIIPLTLHLSCSI